MASYRGKKIVRKPKKPQPTFPSFLSSGISIVSDESSRMKYMVVYYLVSFMWEATDPIYKFRDTYVVKIFNMIEITFLALWLCSVSVIFFKNLLSNTELNWTYLCYRDRVPYWYFNRNDNASWTLNECILERP